MRHVCEADGLMLQDEVAAAAPWPAAGHGQPLQNNIAPLLSKERGHPFTYGALPAQEL
jgi:hypothetical protein